jgi:Holliday junction resolvasome RuvABC endonuclease subunit
MRSNPREERILAISIRSQRLGFAIAEGSLELLNWGMIYYEKNEKTRVRAAAKRIAALFQRFVPSLVAIERSAEEKALNPSGLRSIYHEIRNEATRQSVPVRLLNRTKVRETFRDFGGQSKDDIAALLVRMFPELQPKLPPKRRLWEPEHFSMPMFDAVTLAVACWRRDCLQE